jgi:transcriptional regulator with XRE-family HTH domain
LTGRTENSKLHALGRDFGKNLASKRRQSGFTQDQVAVRSGLHRTKISLLERGQRVPLMDALVRVAAGVEGEPCELPTGLAWPSDYSRLYNEAEGRLEIEVGNRWEEV